MSCLLLKTGGRLWFVFLKRNKLIMASIKKKAFIDIFSLSFGSNVQRVFSFFVFILVMKELTVHDYGILTLLFSITSPFMYFSGIGIGGLITSEIAKARGRFDDVRISRVFFEYYIVKVVIFSLLIALSCIFNDYLGGKYDIYLLRYFKPIIAYVVFLFIIDFNSVLLTSYEKFVKLSIINILEPVSRIVLLIVLFFNGGFDVMDVFSVYIISKAISSVIGFLFVAKILRKLVPLFKRSDKYILPTIMKSYGKWLTLQGLMGNLLKNINPWIIKIFLNTEMVAIFGIAQKITGTISGALSVNTVIFPLINKSVGNENLIDVIIKKSRKYSLYFSMIVVLLVFLFTDFFVLNFVPQYSQSILLIKILILKMIIVSFYVGRASLFYVYNLQKFQFFYSFLSLIQSFIFKIFFLYYFSLVGLALSGLVSSLLGYIVSDYFLSKKISHYKYSLKEYFIFDNYDKKIVQSILNKLKHVFGINKSSLLS